MGWLFNRVDEPESFASTTVVFDGTGVAPVVYTDLDCSPACGAQTCLVLLALENDSGANRNYEFRPNGETRDINGGVSTATTVPDANTAYVVCKTDATGKVEWLASANNVGQVVRVIGYIVLT